jgi:hypothetical protein
VQGRHQPHEDALDADGDVRPLNALLSRFPAPMSAERAKKEGRQARQAGHRLPDGHPYAYAPAWLPLDKALTVERWRLALLGKKPAGTFREDRTVRTHRRA